MGVAGTLPSPMYDQYERLTYYSYYAVTRPAGQLCGAAVNVVIKVTPAPVITAAQAKTICSGAAVNYKVTLTPAGFPSGTLYTGVHRRCECLGSGTAG